MRILTWRQRLIGNPVQRRWWAVIAWFRRCPWCNQRGYYPGPSQPRWAEDKVAILLGLVNDRRCPTCGKRL